MADAIVVVPSAARTASGTSDTLTGFADRKQLRFQVAATAVGTTSTLDVVLEDSLDGTNWNVLATAAQVSAVGHVVANHTGPFADRLRFRWTIAGTAPTVTFDVRLHAD